MRQEIGVTIMRQLFLRMGIRLSESQKKRLHAEVDILENKANGRKVISLFTEFEPCGFKCGPKLDRSKITDVTWSFPWNPPEVRPASRAARDEAIRRLFE